MKNKVKIFYGRIGYDNEGIVREKEFKTKAEADAYVLGALDMQEEAESCEGSMVEDHWAVVSDQESIAES